MLGTLTIIGTPLPVRVGTLTGRRRLPTLSQDTQSRACEIHASEIHASHKFPGKLILGKNARGVEQGNARRVVDERRRRGVGWMGADGSVRMPARSARWGSLHARVDAWRRTPGRTPWNLDVGNDFPSTLSVPERPRSAVTGSVVCFGETISILLRNNGSPPLVGYRVPFSRQLECGTIAVTKFSET